MPLVPTSYQNDGEVRMVPIDVAFYGGPPAAWKARVNGKISYHCDEYKNVAFCNQNTMIPNHTF